MDTMGIHIISSRTIIIISSSCNSDSISTHQYATDRNHFLTHTQILISNISTNYLSCDLSTDFPIYQLLICILQCNLSPCPYQQQPRSSQPVRQPLLPLL